MKNDNNDEDDDKTIAIIIDHVPWASQWAKE